MAMRTPKANLRQYGAKELFQLVICSARVIKTFSPKCDVERRWPARERELKSTWPVQTRRHHLLSGHGDGLMISRNRQRLLNQGRPAARQGGIDEVRMVIRCSQRNRNGLKG